MSILNVLNYFQVYRGIVLGNRKYVGDGRWKMEQVRQVVLSTALPVYREEIVS